jgi:hypothetical protein
MDSKLDPQLKTGAGELFGSWKAWCARTEEFAGSQKRFGQSLRARGFVPDRLTGGKSAFLGIGLNAPAGSGSQRYGD